MDGAGFDDENLADRLILGRLRDAAASAEPVPSEVLRAAYASFAGRTLGAELAELVCDSDMGDGPATTVRLGAAGRLLTFQIPRGGSVELQVVATDDTLHLTGQVVPPRPGEARVIHPAGTTTVPIDDLGSFTAQSIRRGPVRLRLRLAEAGCEIVTESVLL